MKNISTLTSKQGIPVRVILGVITLVVLSIAGFILRQTVQGFEAEIPVTDASVADFQVVYLVAPDAGTAALISSESLSDYLNIRVATDRAAFTEFYADQPQALVIHSSALTWLDVDQVKIAYQEGTVIVGLNLDWDKLADLLGETHCLHRPTGRFQGDFFTLKTKVVLVAKTEEAAFVEDQVWNHCADDVDDIDSRGLVVIHASASGYKIESEAELEVFITLLTSSIEGVESTKSDYASGKFTEAAAN